MLRRFFANYEPGLQAGESLAGITGVAAVSVNLTVLAERTARFGSRRRGRQSKRRSCRWLNSSPRHSSSCRQRRLALSPSRRPWRLCGRRYRSRERFGGPPHIAISSLFCRLFFLARFVKDETSDPKMIYSNLNALTSGFRPELIHWKAPMNPGVLPVKSVVRPS